MKEQYNWNYNIKIKTKEGTYEYEDVPLEDIVLIDLKHPNREELQATQCKHKEHTENTKKEEQCKKKVLKKH